MPRIKSKSEVAGALQKCPAEVVGRAADLTDLDAQLMLELRAGNTEAGNALVRRNFDRVARYVGRVVRDQRPVEDLAQEVFLQIFKAAGRYEPTAKFSTWLYRIATNTARNYLAQSYVRRRREPDPGQGGPVVAAGADSAPERQLSLDDLRRRVADALASLPVNQRIALTLCEYEGLSYEQIAAVLDTTVDAVRGMIKRAREALRPKLRGLV
jgi:RNA polymerase sigma-70 factor (ECF subfamily)